VVVSVFSSSHPRTKHIRHHLRHGYSAPPSSCSAPNVQRLSTWRFRKRPRLICVNSPFRNKDTYLAAFHRSFNLQTAYSWLVKLPRKIRRYTAAARYINKNQSKREHRLSPEERSCEEGPPSPLPSFWITYIHTHCPESARLIYHISGVKMTIRLTRRIPSLKEHNTELSNQGFASSHNYSLVASSSSGVSTTQLQVGGLGFSLSLFG
jgi:hypothetical protein